MAADPSDLAVLADVKAWLATNPTTPSDATNDALLSQLITRASAWIVSYLSRPIKSAAYTDTLRGSGSDSMVMRNYPITAVASVAWNGASITAAANPLNGAGGFLFDGRRIDLIGYCFPYRTPVVITYTAGFATVPFDLVQACVELVGEAFQRRRQIGQASKSLGNGEVVAFMMKDMSEPTRTALASYRNTVPV